MNGKRIISGGLLAGVIISLKSGDDNLIVEVNEPDAVVTISNEQGKVEITRKSDKTPISISVERYMPDFDRKADEAVYARWLVKIDPLYPSRLAVIATNGRNDRVRTTLSTNHTAARPVIAEATIPHANAAPVPGGRPSAASLAPL